MKAYPDVREAKVQYLKDLVRQMPQDPMWPDRWYSAHKYQVGEIFSCGNQRYKVTHIKKLDDALYIYDTRPCSRTEAAVEYLLK
jgi:hypothetical protein